MRPPFQADGWSLVNRLGAGGNGEVWEAHSESGDRLAVKFLTKLRPNRYARFKAEVAAMTSCKGVRGVLPVLSSHLPESAAKSAPPWYSMPLGTPLLAHRFGSVDEVIGAVIDVARALSQIHERGVAHRDIKPANIVLHEGVWCLADFGLVKFDDEEGPTLDQEAVGPKWSIAPEMRRAARDSIAPPADVYSLAKTLWMLLVGDLKGFDGQYDRRSTTMSLRGRVDHDYLSPLHSLIHDATAHDPESRPTASVFCERLEEWVSTVGKQERISVDWRNLEQWLFPFAAPSLARWQDAGEIVQVLSEVAEIPSINHAFFPGGGGLDLDGVVELRPRTVVLDFNGVLHEAAFEFLEMRRYLEPQVCSYFWLELRELEASGVDDYGASRGFEELVQMPDGSLLPRSHWDSGEYVDRAGNLVRLPDSARLLIRILKGPILLVAKTSPYNRDPGAYDGRHAKMSADEFRSAMDRSVGDLVRRVP